jgi:hypothetical protein
MQNTLSPKDLANKTSDEVIANLKSDNNTDDVLRTLQNHYDVLNKTQQMHIDFLSEFVKNLKTLQKKDMESLDNLKKQVLSHVLKNQSNK